MKRTIGFILVMLLAATAVFADYDKATVVAVMRGNLQAIQTAAEAGESGDYFVAAVELMKVAEGMQSIREFEPYRGAKADWNANIDAVVAAAFQGIGACGSQDAEGFEEAIGALWALNEKGHADNK